MGDFDLAEFGRWLGQAKHTYSLIERDIEAGGYDWACFKAQQAAELALKAVLKAVGRGGFGHNLVALYNEVAGVCPDNGEYEACVFFLDKLYIPHRYPDAFTEGEPWEHFSEREAREAMVCAQKILGWVEGCMGGGG